MIWKIFFDAIALVFLIEGLWPFSNPRTYKLFLLMLLAQSEKKLQRIGFGLLLVGLTIAIIVNNL